MKNKLYSGLRLYLKRYFEKLITSVLWDLMGKTGIRIQKKSVKYI